MYTIKNRGDSQERTYAGTDLNKALEQITHEAGIYGFSDLLKDGKHIYTAIKNIECVSVRLIKLN